MYVVLNVCIDCVPFSGFHPPHAILHAPPSRAAGLGGAATPWEISPGSLLLRHLLLLILLVLVLLPLLFSDLRRSAHQAGFSPLRLQPQPERQQRHLPLPLLKVCLPPASSPQEWHPPCHPTQTCLKAPHNEHSLSESPHRKGRAEKHLPFRSPGWQPSGTALHSSPAHQATQKQEQQQQWGLVWNLQQLSAVNTMLSGPCLACTPFREFT